RILPSEWNDDSRAAMLNAVRKYVAERGQQAFLQAVSAGQYSHPQGLFFGGRKRSWSRDTLTRIVREQLGQAQSVAFVDYHSGLGPHGYGECITTEPENSEAHLRARSWYGAHLTTVDKSAAAVVTGDWLRAMTGALPNAAVTGIAI